VIRRHLVPRHSALLACSVCSEATGPAKENADRLGIEATDTGKIVLCLLKVVLLQTSYVLVNSLNTYRRLHISTG